MIVFHAVRVLKSWGEFAVISRQYWFFWASFNNLGYFYRNLSCKSRHSLVKMEVYLAEVLAVSQLTLCSCFACVDFINQRLIGRPLVIHTDNFVMYL